MATFKRFEDIEAWKIARLLCNKIYTIIEETGLNKDYKLRDQINDSSGSIMDNIAEGFGRSGNIEFINFLSVSHGSACECQSQLYRLLDRKYINQAEFDEVYQMADEAKSKILALVRYLQRSDIRGPKFMGR